MDNTINTLPPVTPPLAIREVRTPSGYVIHEPASCTCAQRTPSGYTLHTRECLATLRDLVQRGANLRQAD